MKTLGEILQLTAHCFKEKNIVRARRTAEELLSFVLRMPRMQLYMQFDKPLVQEELAMLRELVRRTLKGEPLEYLLGSVSFYGCTIHIVKEVVIIPRPETEILLDKACAVLKTLSLEGKVAWDICTGSGCLGLGLKKTFPQLSIVLSDISEKALAVARANAEKNALEVECLHSDLLHAFGQRKTDVVLCNPPYISNKEYGELDVSVRGFEPKEALVGGEDGLFFYKQLSRSLPVHLNRGALVFFEIGKDQGDAVQEVFSAPCWRKVSLERDWAGHARFFFLEFE